MLSRGYEFLPPRVDVSDSVDFLVEGNRLRIPLAALTGVGENAAKGIARAFQQEPFISVDDFRVRAKVNATVAETLRSLGVLGELPESNQISFL
jgi:DNA polymerase-3 subunit alpha (Gram-positive type)